MQVRCPAGLAHLPQIPTPQLVMYSMEAQMASGVATLERTLKQAWTIGSGPHRTNSGLLFAVAAEATHSVSKSETKPRCPADPSSVAVRTVPSAENLSRSNKSLAERPPS